MMAGIDQIHAERANGLLLELRGGILEIDVEKNLIGLGAGFVLEAETDPAVLLVGSLVVPGGDGVGEDEKSGMVAANFAEPGEEELIFVVEHGHEALLGDVARAGAVDVVADDLVVGRDGLRDRSRSRANAQKPTCHLLTSSDLGKRSVEGSLQIDSQGFGVKVSG